MGTLTGSSPLLSDHCRHKLPTSCRLTATALCCACQDKRPQSSSYSTYVDGVGLVMRGTRWQRYCFFCKEFWSNRVAATNPPIEPSQTRIPLVPDQTAFLDRWFEYHRGYRIEEDENGGEIKIPISCEIPWRDVDPGKLPVFSEAERAMITQIIPEQMNSGTFVSLESTLDELLLEADGQDQGANTHRNTIVAGQARSEGGVVAERDAVGAATTEARAAITAAVQLACNQLNIMEARLAEAQSRRERAALEMEDAEVALRASLNDRRQAFRQYRHTQEALRASEAHDNDQQRAAQRFARVFGTREEIERQGADYVSPLTTMFTRAYERYSVAEEVRAEARATAQNTERYQQFLQNWTSTSRPSRVEDVVEERPMTLDNENDARPPPLSDAEMKVTLACKICLQQKADTAVLPCGHAVMCSFCADVWCPTSEHDQTRPTGKPSCPVCRKQVKKRVRIYLT